MINDRVQGHLDAAQQQRRMARNLLAQGNTIGASAAFSTALKEIEAGLARLNEEEAPDSTDPTDEDRELATLFAELHGIEGGTYRDMVSLDPENARWAIRAYDAGACYERDFSLKSTYNFVNQLVLRFVATPDLLAERHAALTLEGRNGAKNTDSVAGWLSRADALVEEGYSRRDDPAWALADLALLAALQSSDQLEPRLLRFETQVKRDGSLYPYVSLDRVVRDLLVRSTANSPAGSSLRKLAEWLALRVPAN
jgi:hypothetical protein